jgi:hypothetical protein
LYSLWVGEPGKRPGLRPYNLLYVSAIQIARTFNLDQVLTSLEKHLQLLAAYLAEDYLFVHAGVVGWQGQAIVIPGRSLSGKTTLVKALVEAGADYYSDEFAMLDRQGLVHPYPVPLSVRGRNGGNGQKYPVEALGGQTGLAPIPVGMVVVTEYQAGARWRPRALSPARAMLALMDNTVAARRNPQLSMPILKKAVANTLVLKSKRGEAAEMAEKLLKRMAPIEPSVRH